MEYCNKVFIPNKLVRKLEGCDGERSLLYLTENRILFLLLSQIKMNDTYFESLELSITDYCKFFGISNGGKVKNLLTEAIDFLKNTIFIVEGDPIKFLDDTSDIEKGQLYLLLDDTLEPYLLNIINQFTAFEIGFVAKLKSFYSQKMYLYLHTFMNSPISCRLGIDKVSQVFSDGRYTKPGELNNFVLKKAVDEINELTDITISYQQKCTLGSKPEFVFSVHKKSKDKLDEIRYSWPEFYTTKDCSGIDYERVKEIDIVAYLEEYHDDLIMYNCGTYCHPAHDSLQFYKNRYHQFSTGFDGDLVDYLYEFGDMTKDEIREEMEATDYGCGILRKEKIFAKRKFNVPKRYDANLELVKNYLANREISAEIIDDFIDQGILYADKFKNCVFYNKDKICITRATTDYSPVPKSVQVSEENNYFLFNYGAEFSDKIFVFESVIDLMSYIDYKGAQGYYVAMAGLKDGALEKVVEELNPDGGKEIVLCCDWDEAGKNFAAKYPEYKYLQCPDGFVNCKDWNEFLVAFKNSY